MHNWGAGTCRQLSTAWHGNHEPQAIYLRRHEQPASPACGSVGRWRFRVFPGHFLYSRYRNNNFLQDITYSAYQSAVSLRFKSWCLVKNLNSVTYYVTLGKLLNHSGITAFSVTDCHHLYEVPFRVGVLRHRHSHTCP